VSKLQKAVVARILLFALFWLSGCSFFSTPINISGLWEGTITWTSGPATGIETILRLDLLHEDRDLSGAVTLGGPGGTSYQLAIESGTARTVSMTLTASGVLPINPPQDVRLTLSGDFLGDEMSGTGTQMINGVPYTITWVAHLTAPAAPQE